jgi:hypothetical protein
VRSVGPLEPSTSLFVEKVTGLMTPQLLASGPGWLCDPGPAEHPPNRRSWSPQAPAPWSFPKSHLPVTLFLLPSTAVVFGAGGKTVRSGHWERLGLSALACVTSVHRLQVSTQR